jgi:bifunctional UDP-N-acetylglucosamine pyrophosphorylase/glucosamine-1-phosphate N-acetyltransferase
MATQRPSVASIILAAGKGTRINSKDKNKVAYHFLSKPMVVYGVELFAKFSEPLIVVVGAFAESVKEALKDYPEVIFVNQKEQLGTGHAVKVALRKLEKKPPKLVLVGMGDHMMFYKQKTIEKLITTHLKEKATITFITTHYDKPDELAWGRVERDKNRVVRDIVEQKDATEKQRKIKEVNAGLYCFNYKFLRLHIDEIKKSPVTGEYYLTDIILRAFKNYKRVIGMPVRFREVGIGVNRADELEKSQSLFKRFFLI